MNGDAAPDAGGDVRAAEGARGRALRFDWTGEWVLQLPCLPRLSGRLRAGAVLGLRRLPGTDLPEQIAQRILEKLDASGGR